MSGLNKIIAHVPTDPPFVSEQLHRGGHCSPEEIELLCQNFHLGSSISRKWGPVEDGSEMCQSRELKFVFWKGQDLHTVKEDVQLFLE